RGVDGTRHARFRSRVGDGKFTLLDAEEITQSALGQGVGATGAHKVLPGLGVAHFNIELFRLSSAQVIVVLVPTPLELLEITANYSSLTARKSAKLAASREQRSLKGFSNAGG